MSQEIPLLEVKIGDTIIIDGTLIERPAGIRCRIVVDSKFHTVVPSPILGAPHISHNIALSGTVNGHAVGFTAPASTVVVLAGWRPRLPRSAARTSTASALTTV